MSQIVPPPSPAQPGSQAVPPAPGRAEIVDWLSGLGERPPGSERIDSMELAWLVHQVEQRYAVELSDDHLDRIHTIDEAVAVLAEVLGHHA